MQWGLNRPGESGGTSVSGLAGAVQSVEKSFTRAAHLPLLWALDGGLTAMADIAGAPVSEDLAALQGGRRGAAATPTRVTLLDGFRIATEGAEPELPHNAERLVAHLGLNQRSHRSVVAGVLWPEVPERRAQGSLRSTLWRVERSYPGLIRCAQRTIFLAPQVTVDVRQLTLWARQTLDPDNPRASGRAPDFAFSGELLPGWYDDWVLMEREFLHQLRLHALEQLAQKLAGEGRFGEALEAAHGALRCEPLRESAHRLAIKIHLAEGNAAAALRHYDRFEAALLSELAVRPGPRIAQLVAPYRSVRRRRDAAPQRAAESRGSQLDPGATGARGGRWRI